MNFLSRYVLLFISILSLTATQVSAEGTVEIYENDQKFVKVNKKKKRMFSRNDVLNLCETMKVDNSQRHGKYMDILIKNAGITKEQWNKHYFFKVKCVGSTPLYYALRWDLDDFVQLANYGIDLNHAFKDDDGNISTVKDYIRYKYKIAHPTRRKKWRKIYTILKEKGAKSCKELPSLNCTSTYL